MKLPVVLASLLAAACGASAEKIQHYDVSQDSRAAGKETSVTGQDKRINQQFRTLDEYLAFLERTEGPIDGPWYRQVGPGVYELQTGNLRVLGVNGEEPQAKHTFTREELERKFGFRD